MITRSRRRESATGLAAADGSRRSGSRCGPGGPWSRTMALPTVLAGSTRRRALAAADEHGSRIPLIRPRCRWPCSSRATFAGRPGTACSSSREAASTASGEPKCASSARLRAGPMPGRSSSSELVIARSRRVRWWVIAKRWASSRTRCSSCSSGVSWASTSGAGAPGRKISSIRLASEIDRHAALAEAAQRRPARPTAGPCRRRSRPGWAARRSSGRTPGRAARCRPGAPTGRSGGRAPRPSRRSRPSPRRCGS